MHAKLSWAERLVYWTVNIGTIGWSIYHVYRMSADSDGMIGRNFLEKGWILSNSWKDTSDITWLLVVDLLRQLWVWYLGFVLVSRLIAVVFPTQVKLIQLLYSWICLYHTLEKPVLIINIGLVVLFHLISYTQRMVVIWTTALILIGLSCWPSWVTSTPVKDYGLFFYLTVPAVIRCVSFALEAAMKSCQNLPKSKDTTRGDVPDEQENLVRQSQDSLSKEKVRQPGSYCSFLERSRSIDGASKEDLGMGMLAHFHYTFYLPLFFTGPMMNYCDFRTEFNKSHMPWTIFQLFLRLANICRIMMWLLFNELTLELLYFGAIGSQTLFLETLSPFCIFGTGYLLGQFYTNKFVVIYGFTREVAKFDDLKPPEGPRCLNYIYLYSRLWKSFDQGLYRFMLRYIFQPVQGLQRTLMRRTVGSALCFSFILLWHGLHLEILVWVLLNYIQYLLEMSGTIISTSSMYISLKKRLSPQAVRRLHAAACVPLVTVSWFSAFFFLGGYDFGLVSVRKLILTSNFSALLLYYYIFVQVSMDVENFLEWKSHKD